MAGSIVPGPHSARLGYSGRPLMNQSASGGFGAEALPASLAQPVTQLKQHSNPGGLLLQDSGLNCCLSLLKKLKQMLIIWQNF